MPDLPEVSGNGSPLIAVVTGGATGIGGATAEMLLSQAWQVHTLDRAEHGPEGAVHHVADVTNEAALLALAEDVGPVDALVTAAGINLRPHDGPAQRLELDAWHKTLDVNLTGTMLSVRAFYPKLRDAGSIVTLGSVAGIGAMTWADAYTWLAKNPRVTFHFTPTTGSWLNLVEVFFGIITRQAIRRGSFGQRAPTRRRDQRLHRRLERPLTSLQLDQDGRRDPAPRHP